MRILRLLLPLVVLSLILLSNALLVHPREMASDIVWLLQDSSRKETARDVRRVGSLQVTPTRVSVGESVWVTVVDGVTGSRRALVMIDSEGNYLDIRNDPLRTQEFVIPVDGAIGEYRFWLAGESLHPGSGLGIIMVEVYREDTEEDPTDAGEDEELLEEQQDDLPEGG